MIPLVLSAVALVVSLATLVLVILVARQSARLSGLLDRHRNGHRLRDGAPDPATARSHRPERRMVNLGPPRGTGERRQRPGEPPEVAAGPDATATGPLPVHGAEEPRTAQLRRVLPRPGQIGER